MKHVGDDSPVDQLAGTLAGLRQARDLADAHLPHRVLAPPRRLYPMSLVASQLTINPFEFFMLVALLITGVSYTLGVTVPVSVSDLLPRVWTQVWVLNIGLGSLCALIGGLLRRDPDRGLLVYQFGWGLCGLATAVYGTAVLLKFPLVGLYPGLTNLMIAAACLVRVLQIQRFFRIADLMRRGLLTIPVFVPVKQSGGESRDNDARGTG